MSRRRGLRVLFACVPFLQGGYGCRATALLPQSPPSPAAAEARDAEARHTERRLHEKAIYGTDHRDDLFVVRDPRVKANAAATVAILRTHSLQRLEDGSWRLLAQTFGDRAQLCPGEPFIEQPSAARCSGFLVTADRIVTAGHCVTREPDLSDLLFVFDYRMQNSRTAVTSFPPRNVYRGVRLLGRELDDRGADWAVVQLDRPVDRTPLTVRTSGFIADSQDVYVIGCPSGIPLKYAPGARVRENAQPGYFVANLDAFGGNSGSPVFDARSHRVEGVLARGEADFVEIEGAGCFRSKVCPDSGCAGEAVTRIRHIPAELLAPAAADPSDDGKPSGRGER